MAPTKPSDTSCKPTVASAGTTLARGYRRDDLLPHPNNANLKRDDDDTSSLSSSDTTHESTQPSPVVAAAKVDDAVDDADDGDMKPAAKDDDEVVVGGEVVQIKREMNEYDEDTVASNNDDMEDDTKPAAAAAAVVQPPPTTVTPSSFIDSHQNDFSERGWWMVDIIIDDYNSDGNSIITQGASPLVKRCMRRHVWSLTKTRMILSAYKQFLMLKKQLEDWNATLLSPCYLVGLDVASTYT